MEKVIVFISVLLQLINYAIIIRVIMSWVNINKSGGFYLFIRDITEPILAFFKRIIPQIGMIDISPVVAIFLIDFIRLLLLGTL